MNVPTVYNIKNKGVIGISKDKLIQYKLLNTVLKTHESLSNDDISFGINNILKLNLDDINMTKFLLHSYKSLNSGRFSLTYNKKLDEAIKSRNNILLPGDKDWPELYDNSELSSEDINTIEEMYNREYYAILNAIEKSRCVINLDEILQCDENKTQVFNIDNKDIYYNSLYSKCYENICIQESIQKGKIISLNSNIPKIAYVSDENKDKIYKFCFPIMELIEQFAKNDYINHQNNERFSERTIEQILNKYRKEIAMYKRYLNN